MTKSIINLFKAIQIKKEDREKIIFSFAYQDSLVNGVTKINDSTIRVFKAGTSTDLLIRGNASGGGGGSQNLNQVAQVDSSLLTTIIAYSPNGVDTLAIRDSLIYKLKIRFRYKITKTPSITLVKAARYNNLTVKKPSVKSELDT